MRSCRGMAVLRFDRDEPPVIDVSRCMNCQVCMGMCPFGAVIWRW
ncbi:MAG: 4Fe-4S binding protein [Anaerolineales bacterium]|nr:4Fe-4S binding protein [Anaerolineales bacterium]